MSPLDRISQLTDENALLRSQLQDAQQQAKRDSETIARLAKGNPELREESVDLLNAIIIWLEADMRKTPPPAESMAAYFIPSFCKNARKFLSRHA